MFSGKTLTTVCAVALLSASMHAAPWTVVLPQSPNRGEQRAAAELAEHLGEALHADIAIKREGEAVSGKTLLVGRTLAAKAVGVDTSGMGDEEWRLKAMSDSQLILAGGGQSGRGTLYAAYEAMERLRPKRMVATECGHAYRATVIEGPYWAGRPDGKPPVECIHYVEWVAEALETGKLKIDPAKRIKEPVTVQDSCNYVRNAGLRECTRIIMKHMAEDFREMAPNKEHNYCCGGGGGFNGIGRYRKQRNDALKMKREQILATGAKFVIAPCHNCWDAIRDLEEEYEIGIRWSFLKPLLVKMVEVPEHLLPKE